MRVGIAVLLAAVLFCWGTAPAVRAASFVDYLYVEANEGDSSGGHVALRFGDEVFHFQHESPGILRLQRHESPAFYHVYAMLGNRAVHESRIALSDDSYHLLRQAFVRLQLVQDAQLQIRDALQRDVALFDRLLRQRAGKDGGNISLSLATLGYFLPDAPPDAGAAPSATESGSSGCVSFSPALAALRDRIAATYGDRAVTERIAGINARLRGLELRACVKPVQELSRESFPTFEPPLSTRYEDELRALFALRLLQAAPGLREGSYWTPDDELFKLQPREAAALERFRAKLVDDLVRLFDSRRSDWGAPFILGMARLAAVEATLASGRLVLLDIFPPDVPLPPRHDSALRPYLPMMAAEMREVFLQKRKSLFEGDALREAGYAALESSGNVLLDIERAMATGAPLRAIPKDPFPSRAATVSVPPPGEPDQATLTRELAAAKAAERDYAALLDRLYAYDLLRRNCVTELFSVINSAVAGGSAGGGDAAAGGADLLVQSESRRRLGGFIDPAQGLGFIPLISKGEVEGSYTVVRTGEHVSYRTARLAEMKRRESPLKVFLRESNTITSTVYRRGPGDSAFLFFTDDTLLLRPVFGAFNLLTGLGEGLYGVLILPVQGPERLVSGARGMLFSLPELLFLNLRKGSMAYVEQSAAAP